MRLANVHAGSNDQRAVRRDRDCQLRPSLEASSDKCKDVIRGGEHGPTTDLPQIFSPNGPIPRNLGACRLQVLERWEECLETCAANTAKFSTALRGRHTHAMKSESVPIMLYKYRTGTAQDLPGALASSL